MAKWAVVDFVDLLLVGSVLARAAHPELIVHQWTTGHNACRELGVTVWAGLTPRNVQRKIIIIHQTHYEKSDWSRAFNQFTIACELDMINAMSAAGIAFIMSSSTSAWLLSPVECSPQKQNG